MRWFVLLLLAGLSFPASSPAQDHYQYPFQNPNLPTEQRIDNLLSLMTLQEKIDALGTDPDVPAWAFTARARLKDYTELPSVDQVAGAACFLQASGMELRAYIR